MSSERRHTEFNFLLIVVMAAFALFVTIIVNRADVGQQLATWIPPAIMVVILLMLARTQVTVSAQQVTMRFTFPVPARTNSVADVTQFRIIKVPWWVGWGFRMGPGRRCWRAGGTRAVEFERTQGPRFWLGCKDPDAVVELLRSYPEWAQRYRADS